MTDRFSRCMGRSTGRAGFTLIELLVVVAIIAGLIAILLPSLRAAKALAKRVACGANLKDLGIAWTAYLTDHDGRFYQGQRANLDYGGWMGTKRWAPRPLNKYVGLPPTLETEKRAEVFLCPADRGGIPPGRPVKVHHVNGTSYQTNIFLIGQDRCDPFSEKTEVLDLQISDRLPNQHLNRVTNHSLLLLIGDYGWINQWKPRANPYPDSKDLAEWHGKVDHHNMAFLDGHVDYLNIRKGFYVSDTYCVLPFEELFELAMEVQGPAD